MRMLTWCEFGPDARRPRVTAGPCRRPSKGRPSGRPCTRTRDSHMFDLPELATLARQMNEVLPGKMVRDAVLGNRPHRFVWYNRTPNEFRELTPGLTVGTARAQGKWLFLA